MKLNFMHTLAAVMLSCLTVTTLYSCNESEPGTDHSKLPPETLPDFVPDSVVVFFDDFNQMSSTPDPTKWTLCKRQSSDWNKKLSESYDQAYVKDGMLCLVAEKKNGQVVTGGVCTQGLFSFKYGHIDVKARFTHTGQGAWPAIWMMPQTHIYSGWPACGEIDIMEHLNYDSSVWQTVHSEYREAGRESQTFAVQPRIQSGEFNIYGFDWDAEEMHFYINGRKTMTFRNMHLPASEKQWPFDTDWYIILNQAAGGSWVGSVNENELPFVMEVDWVKVTVPNPDKE